MIPPVRFYFTPIQLGNLTVLSTKCGKWLLGKSVEGYIHSMENYTRVKVNEPELHVLIQINLTM